MQGSAEASCNVDGDYQITDEFGNIIWDLPSPDYGSSYSASFCVPFQSIEGCTDPEALNYNSTANLEDGSCEYTGPGQIVTVNGVSVDLDQILEQGQHIMLVVTADWDPFSPTIIPQINDTYTSFGCNLHDLYVINVPLTAISDENMITFANNNGLIPDIISFNQGGEELISLYNFSAVPSIILIAPNGQVVNSDLYGSILNDTVITTIESYGLELNPCAVLGCTNPAAFNYNSNATSDDDSCELVNCSNLSGIDWDGLDTGVYPAFMQFYLGESVNVDNVINVGSIWEDDSNGNVYNAVAFNLQSISGLPEGITSEDSGIQVPSNTQGCFSYSGLAFPTGVHTIELSGLMTVLIADIAIQLPATFTQTIEVIWDGNDISGCTYPGALNFNAVANIDDGSCLFLGCTDSSALNFNPIANINDESCLYADGICGPGLIWNAELGLCQQINPTCDTDLNGDGSVTASDLTIFLITFGTNCP